MPPIVHQIVLETSRFFHPEDFDESRYENRAMARESDDQNLNHYEFLSQLRDEAGRHDLVLVDLPVEPEELRSRIEESPYPHLMFRRLDDGWFPLLLFPREAKRRALQFVPGDRPKEVDFDQVSPDELRTTRKGDSQKTQLEVYVLMQQAPIFTMPPYKTDQKPSPLQRLYYLLLPERKDIYYVLLFAIVVGLINLSLPLGIQAIIGLVSGGFIPGSVVVLIGFVIIGVLLVGVLQIVEITLVEFLQRRLFARSSLELAYRLPRVLKEKIKEYHTPELVNRFFDVMTIQKGYSKVLLELTSALLQIVSGLLLLAFYHQTFIAFGGLVLFILVLFLRSTSKAGLATSIEESDHKYKMAYWLEEIARCLNTFKLAGKTSLPFDRTSRHVALYLDARRRHFDIVKRQFYSLVAFKTIIAGSVLIIGSVLYVNNEMTLGQFVASEIIIVQLITSIESIMSKVEGIYDLLTAVEKVAKLTDLPLEKEDGRDVEAQAFSEGIDLKVRKLSYRDDRSGRIQLQDIKMDIESGCLVCFSGLHDCGKFTMAEILTGLIQDYQGAILVNGIPLRELQPMAYRGLVDTNDFEHEIFEGTFRENVLVGSHNVSQDQLRWALKTSGLDEYIASMEKGLDSDFLPEGRDLPHFVRARIFICRMLIRKPSLLIMVDYFGDYSSHERHLLMGTLLDRELINNTKIAVTNDPALLSTSDKIYYFRDHQVAFDGKWDEFQHTEFYQSILQHNDTGIIN